ncbi:2-polyprenyl-3-methyl-6-methoxy-1,4-benzoquinone monooxygenase [Candidatus Pandoraea novymonadis]|uniref:2-polyprenyl-3-methyl-6-methoxy-1,4-benzoquinone monooxygenase n=1 Tax=Candidatus Pandoraea novymonadis TaxID=1808959 RepID=UPI000D07FAA4|nr:2-polyprenyl-3-methyl-6-methoxy-1,4-benzoquinone monooxygenase [Candidatus Pandoraea novymonadis]
MLIDRLINEFDRGLQAILGITRATRPVPTFDTNPADMLLSLQEKRHVIGLMRVNHVGEVCAQALYQAQKLATKDILLRDAFAHAQLEEEDHLAWTAERLSTLGSHPSLLNPLWYTGAFIIGFCVGKIGDKTSLSFMAETEWQVENHLNNHLESLPLHDYESRAIVNQMRLDEAAHAQAALDSGGVELSWPIRKAMSVCAKMMTTIAYYI